MPWDYGWHMGWMMTWGSIVGMLVLLGMIWLVLRSSAQGQSDSPEAILKRRYAHGDIDHDEYERRLNDLRQ